MLLDLDAIRNGKIHDYPYRWILFNNVIRESAKHELVSTPPPEDQFEYDGDDGYIHGFGRSLDEGTQRVFPLRSAWTQLIDELRSSGYRNAIAELTGLDLSNQILGMRFYRYNPGHGTYPHHDHPANTLVHMFYFCEKWDSRWGGCFRILKEENPDSGFLDIPPLFDISVAFVRSDNSWHMVPHIAPDVTQIRYALKACFYKPQE
ncbi:MAG: 2OG-Fe(II) oxygenase [Nostoc sp.]|uniref:2OG-Fe(II) oxygenase n=2 Tax=Nostoc sp. TaxID=1180 RepID=UPI002FFA5579